jgi:hypothetical protein
MVYVPFLALAASLILNVNLEAETPLTLTVPTHVTFETAVK